MSMCLDVIALSEAAFKKVKDDASLLEELFTAHDGAAALKALGVKPKDRAGCDYRTLAEAQEAMAELDDDDSDNDDDSPDFSPTGELEFDAGYGPAFFVAPKDAKVLESDAWDMAANLDKELASLLNRARKQRLYIVAAVR